MANLFEREVIDAAFHRQNAPLILSFLLSFLARLFCLSFFARHAIFYRVNVRYVILQIKGTFKTYNFWTRKILSLEKLEILSFAILIL